MRSSSQSVVSRDSDAFRSGECGSVLLVVVVLMLAFGSLVTASLAVMVSENKKGTAMHRARQVNLEAQGQLELAKNIVNASQYDVDMKNLVLGRALGKKDQVIPNTDVRVERVGTTGYFVLRTQATRNGFTKSAEAIVRQTSPASANNLVVIDHPVGISGSPRGVIHSNKYIDFYFPGGLYRDQVTASEGFNFVSGASTANTTFSGPINPKASKSDPLADIDFDKLWIKGDILSVTENYTAEMKFDGDRVEVQLFRPAFVEKIPRTRIERRYSHTVKESYIDFEKTYEEYTYSEKQPVYKIENYIEIRRDPVYEWRDAKRTVSVPITELREVDYTVSVPIRSTRKVQVEVVEFKWISYAKAGTASSGGTVGGAAGDGYWKKVKVQKEVDEEYTSGYKEETRKRMEMVLVRTDTRTESYREQYVDHYDEVKVPRTRSVPDGYKTVTKTGYRHNGWKEVEKTRDVKKYKDVEVSYIESVRRKEKLMRKLEVPLNGTIYLKGSVRKISGEMDGRLSLISGGSVKITDDILYVDVYGEKRMLNGDDHNKPYIENPLYTGNSLLAIMAKRDIIYSKDGPRQLEINASLISAEGGVRFEGIKVSKDGSSVWTDYADEKDHVLDYFVRLGGIVSRKRSIVTYIDDKGFIAAGFEFGSSIMDQNLILSSGSNAPPPFMFESARPTWIMSTAGTKLGAVQ